MSFRDCINKAERDGDITPEQAARSREIFADEHEQLRADLGDEGALDEAARRAFQRMEADALQARRQVRLQQKANRRILDHVLGADDPAAAAADIIEHFGARSWSSVTQRYHAVRGRAHGLMSEVILRFERDLKGETRNRAQLDNMVRELFGTDTGDASARELARAWSESAEWLRRRFNAAGGAVAKREDWGLPQKHDSRAIRQVSLDEWIAYVTPRLDRARMVDDLTGLPPSAEALHRRLVEAYSSITTDGWASRPLAGRKGASKLANQRQDPRFLVFRDADAWLEYQGRFGHADSFAAMMEHVDSLARDIASVEILGPNPTAQLRQVNDVVMANAAISDAVDGGVSHTDHARGRLKLMNDMYEMHSGSAFSPVDGRLSRWVGTLASLKVSAQLGSAMLSAISDLGFGKMARQMAGLPERVPLEKIVRLMARGEGADKRAAISLGLVAEGAANLALGQTRYAGDFVGHEWARRLSDLTLRWSLLSPWTQAGRWSFGMEFMSYAAGQRGKAFNDLDAPFRETLERHGFDVGTWDAVRAADLYEPRPGSGFLRPDEIAARPGTDREISESLADRWLEMIQTETEYAVPTASLRGRSYLVSGNRPGTLVGTVLRSLAMYKSFPVTVMLLYGGRTARVAAQAGTVMAGRFAAKALITTTVLGALALQLKEISKGRDPRPMGSPEFWGAAVLQGGGLGIFGDFLGSDVNRFGGGLAPTIAGPLGQLADDVRRLTIGNAMQFAADEETNIGAELRRFIGANTPGGSLWYLRLGYDRLVLDELQKAIDPDAWDSFARTEGRYARDRGQRYWWRPGERAPERAPDPLAALAPAPVN